MILQEIKELREILEKPAKDCDENQLNKLQDIADYLIEAESHHRREDEALFLELEQRGLTGPPEVMRIEYEELRSHKGALKQLVATHKNLDYRNFLSKLREDGGFIVENLHSHIFKENNILYPTALQTIEKETWMKIKKKFDEIGYCCFSPGRGE